MKKIPSLPLILLLLLPVSCHRPASTEQFVTIDKSVGGIYGFTLDLSDTLCAYDIWFYNRVEPALGGVESGQVEHMGEPFSLRAAHSLPQGCDKRTRPK